MSGRAHAGSLGWRLLLAIVGCAALGIVATGVVAWTSARALTLQGVDEEFRRQVEHMALHVLVPPADRPPPPGPPPLPPGGHVPFTWVLDLADHRTVLKLPAWPDAIALDPWALRSGELVELRASDGGRWHALARDTTLPDHLDDPLAMDLAQPPRDQPPRHRLIVLRDVTPEYRGLARLAWTIAGLGSAILALAVAVGLGLRSAVLTPVRRLERRISQLDPAAPGEPVEDGLVPSELGPIVDRVNALVARVAELLARERRVGADIAHELRTPLAALRSDLSFAQRAAKDAEIGALLGRLDGQARVLQDRIQGLLMLTRIENGQVGLRDGTITVGELAADAWGRATEQRGRLACGAGMDLALRGDPDLLRMVFSNLVDNAIAHGSGGGCEISARAERSAVAVEVANAATLPDGDYDEAFAPFWRRDRSRTGTADHAGLGLALVRRIAEAHGGRASARVAEGRFCVSVELPAGI
jgi:signal transduction histidine kinase